MKTQFSKLDTHLTRRKNNFSSTNHQSDHLQNGAGNSYKTTLAIAYQSSMMIKKISSVWSQIYQSQPFSGVEANVCRAIHFQNNRLVIECDSPTVANHLRFNQSQLIKQLHKYQFTAVNDLKLIIKHKANISNSTTKNQRPDSKKREKPSDSILSALSTCAETTSNSKLRESLNRLQQQLKTR